MKKVLHYVALMNRAGQETFIMNVFRAIDKNVISFDFLCCLPGNGDYDEEIRTLGGEVYHITLSNKNSKLKQIDNFFILFNYLKSKKDKYVAFHIHTQHAMDGFKEALAAKLAGIPIVIVHSHSTSTLFHINAHKIFRRLLNRLPITKLACSELAGKWLYGDKGKFEVIRNGVDIEKYKYDARIRSTVRKENGWENKVVVGHVGSFTYPKNHEFIVDVFCSFLKIEPNAQLVLAGKGELIESVKEKCRMLGIYDHVAFLGTRSDVDRLDQAFDIMLFPSRYEGLPVVLVEAQCTGLPCLISDTITTEVDLTNLVKRLSITDDVVSVWADNMLKLISKFKLYNREETVTVVADKKYGMNETVNRLMEIYCGGNKV